MSTGRDLLHLGIALVGFYVVLLPTAILIGLVVDGMHPVVVTLVYPLPPFLAGAKLYHWLTQEDRGW